MGRADPVWYCGKDCVSTTNVRSWLEELYTFAYDPTTAQHWPLRAAVEESNGRVFGIGPETPIKEIRLRCIFTERSWFYCCTLYI
jgi:hypothetical protein